MSKGYVKLALIIIFIVVGYIIVNYIIARMLNREIMISDYVSQFYRMVNAVEAVRAHSRQLLEYSVQDAKKDLGVIDVNQIKNDDNLKNQFIEKIKLRFHPHITYSNVDAVIKINSVDVEDSRVVSVLNLEVTSLNPELSGCRVYGDMKVWSEI